MTTAALARGETLHRMYEALQPRVLAFAAKLTGRQNGEDVAARAWEKYLTTREKKRIDQPLSFLLACVKLAAAEQWRADALMQKKRAALAAGEQIRGGGRTCPWCGRPSRVGAGGYDGNKDGLCEAHYYRRYRALKKGRVPDMAAPIRPTFREKQKLSDEQVAALRTRLAAGEKGTALARELGVGTAQVSRIRNGLRRGGAKRKPGKGYRSDLRS